MASKHKARKRQDGAPRGRAWYQLKNLAGGITDVSIFDEIGIFGITAQDFLSDLSGVTGPVNLHLNSAGGEIFDGIAIYNALRQRGGVAVTIDGYAASIASVIAMAADPGKLAIAKRASMMIHDGFSQAVGNAKEMRELADLLDQQSDNIAGIYADRTGIPAATWRDRMRAETWYVGQQAVDAGLADVVVDGGAIAPPVTNATPLSRRLAARTLVVVNATGAHAPMTGTHTHAHPSFGMDGDAPRSREHSHDGDANHQSAAGGSGTGNTGGAPTTNTVRTTVTAQGRPCPACSHGAALHALFCANCGVRLLMAADESGWVQDPNGKWRFDPDGDGDDDATPEGDTDHDYFDDKGRPIPGKEIPPMPAAARDAIRRHLHDADIDESQWDADKAWHNGATAQDPAAFYRGICAGRRSGDPKLQSSWALPYKYHPADPPNAAGVRAALSRLSTTQGLTNEDEARSKLEGLMKRVNPDYEKQSDVDDRLLQSVLLSALEGSKR